MVMPLILDQIQIKIIQSQTLLKNFLKISAEGSSWKEGQNKTKKIKESQLLKLNCDKALQLLHWSPTLEFQETIYLTIDWYYDFYNQKSFNTLDKCIKQINQYTKRSLEKIN